MGAMQTSSTKKKTEPNTLSAIVIDDWAYLKACKPVKISAKNIVSIVPKIAAFLLEANKPWWAKVIVAKSPVI